MDTERTPATSEDPTPEPSPVGAAEGTASLYPNDSRVPGSDAADPTASKELGNAAPAVGPKRT